MTTSPIHRLLPCLLLAALLLPASSQAQSLAFPPSARTSPAALASALPELARTALKQMPPASTPEALSARLLLQLVTGEHAAALQDLGLLREARQASDPDAVAAFTPFEVDAKAQQLTGPDRPFAAAYRQAFAEVFERLSHKQALRAEFDFGTSLARLESDCRKALEGLGDKELVPLPEALTPLRRCAQVAVYRRAQPFIEALLAQDDARRYDIQTDVLIKTPAGASLSAVVARPRDQSTPQPAALYYFVYANLANSLQEAKQAAARGYVGVVVDVRGKRLSPDRFVPYENEVQDTHDAIAWIARQPWSDGRVAMYGGSYTGFAQWAATKKLHPALKTIVPYVAAIPGQGLPMENNIFLNANYGWAFYVGNNKYLDNAVYNDRERWNALPRKWYASGRPYREIDTVDGTPNPALQRWLRHPAFDAYWQSMIPWRQDYARIDIPVLSVTGYFDDGQISALHYLREHYRYKPDAQHYLLIGPYDHFGAQNRPAAAHAGYTIDPVAHINVREITFQWLDHVLRGTERPALLKDRINHQVMGANVWRHEPSLEALQGQPTRLYLSNSQSSISGHGRHHVLAPVKPTRPGHLAMTVDLADRSRSYNDYYPYPVLGKEPDLSSGFSFISEPLGQPMRLSGLMSGRLNLTINKRDLDVGVVLYEVMPDGKLFHLGYYIGRASHARDMTRRQLLTPGRKAAIPFETGRMVSRQLSAGSRLLVTLNINANPYAQVNHGSGKDVSDESIADAGAPMQIKWHNDSFVELPLHRSVEVSP